MEEMEIKGGRYIRRRWKGGKGPVYVGLEKLESHQSSYQRI